MRNNVKCYKVVENINGVYRSAFNNMQSVTYFKDKLARPHKNQRKLFVFADLESARRFPWGDEIWECAANDVVTSKDEAGFRGNFSFPKNTMFASSVKLVKKIENKNS